MKGKEKAADGLEDSTGSPCTFSKAPYNIIDPLDANCNFCDGITAKYVMKVTESLDRGAIAAYGLLAMIKSFPPVDKWSDKEATSVTDALNSIFELSFGRFKGGWRPDVDLDSLIATYGKVDESFPQPEKCVVSPPSGSYAANAELLWKNVEYCSLLLTSDITAPALLSLTTEILSQKGPLPVGEIGKLLQESTSNPSLSAALKGKIYIYIFIYIVVSAYMYDMHN